MDMQTGCNLKVCLKSNWGGAEGVGEVAQTMYTHVSKCKNDKIKERKKKQLDLQISNFT
jgi:hypothetical protein